MPLFGNLNRTLAVPGGIFGTEVRLDDGDTIGRVTPNLEVGKGDKASTFSSLSCLTAALPMV